MSTVPRHPIESETEVKAVVLGVARSEVEDAVQRFEAAAGELCLECLATVDLRRMCGEIAAFTGELFPGEIRIRVKNDPEIDKDLYFVFAVCATGDIDDIVQRNDQWHRRVMRIEAAQHGLFRLAIDAR